MGGEFGQWNEWYHEAGLDWHLLDEPRHKQLQRWVADLNRFYQNEPALYTLDFDPAGFQWIDCNDSQQSSLSLLRRGTNHEDTLIIACNFTPVPRTEYRLGVPMLSWYQELLNSDAKMYGGSNIGNSGGVQAEEIPWHGQPYSIFITLPPLSAVFFKPQ